MADMAQAAVLTAPRAFDYREYPLPETGRDDGLRKIEAGGLCGTDYEQYCGHLTGTPWDVFPVIPGHEIMGWVDIVGGEAAKP
jgi:D-arabinose 1-dehydrogenase-like Zn-dependent alcohol dehydrogenase